MGWRRYTPAMSVIERTTNCFICSYDLIGLSPEGVCPECGSPISRSLAGNQLINASPDYLVKLHRGVFLVQAAIIVQLLIGFASFGVVLATGAGAALAGASTSVRMILALASIPVSVMTLLGWWWFSEPDPGFVGTARGGNSRRIVRVTVIVQAAITGVSVPLSFLAPPGSGMIWDVLTFVFGAFATIAWGVQFFAAMLYLRWLAPRIPNEKVYNRAKTLMWLGPVLMTVGILLLLLGPLIALVLYYNMLEWARKDLKRIRREQTALSPS